jgi:hypothetical protein
MNSSYAVTISKSMMPDLMTLRRSASVCTICAIGNALWRARIVGPRVEKERREAETLAWARWRAMTASVAKAWSGFQPNQCYSSAVRNKTQGRKSMKKFAVLLTMIFVFAGSAQARISSSRTFAHFPTCTDGLVKKMCVCRSTANPLGPPHQLCPSGWYCHTSDGACRQ